MTLFCKQKEFNSEIIFVLISDYDFGYYVVNGIKCHFWLNAYFVKELHLNCKCLWACPKWKSLPQRFENENVYINELYLINGFDKRLQPGVPWVSVQIRQPGRAELGGRYITYQAPDTFIPPQTYTSPSIPQQTYTPIKTSAPHVIPLLSPISLPSLVSQEPASMAVDITLSSLTLSSLTLPPIDEIDETMVNLVSELGALLARRPRAPYTRRVLHPSAPSAQSAPLTPSAPFEIARDPTDQPTVYSRWRPKRNIKTPSCGPH